MRRALASILKLFLRAASERGSGGAAARLVLLTPLMFFALGWQSAQAQLTIKPATWNVIGLDSNNVNDGPNEYQVGATACNTGGATLYNLRGDFVWDSSNAYINLGGSSVSTVYSLAPGACVGFYYPITVTRTNAARDAARRYHITVSANGAAAVSTPTPRELYVERLISQNRNTVNFISGPTSVRVGQTYSYTLNASTSTSYPQFEAFINLSNVVYQVLSVSSNYTNPAGATNDSIYADACGWQNNPTLPNYKNCVGPDNFSGGKVGGTVNTTYTVKILAMSGAATASTLILDYSGSSYHYSSGPSLTITALPPELTLSKLSNKSSTLVGTNVTYTLRVTNPGTTAYTLTEFVDTPPTSPAAPSYIAGSSAFNGAAIGNPVQSSGTLRWVGSFTIPAGQSRDLTYSMTMPNTAGVYTNSAFARLDFTQIDTTADSSDNAPASVSVTVLTPPSIKLVKSCTSPANCMSGGARPGVDLTYTISFTNEGGSAAQSLSIVDIIPVSDAGGALVRSTEFKVGSMTFNPGTTGLTITPAGYRHYSDAVAYPVPLPPWSPSTSYTPPGGGGTYDANVTYAAWQLTGNMPAGSSGSVTFTVRIK